MIFVFGTGRCGTVSLSKFFQKNTNFTAFHEGLGIVDGKPVDLGVMTELNKHIYYTKRTTKAYHNSIICSGKTLNIMKSLFHDREQIFSKINGPIIDINPYEYSFINYIYKLYPSAKFVHIVRSGREVVTSYLGRRFTYPNNISENKYSGFAAGKPRPLSDDPWFSKWDALSRLDKTCWFWNYVNKDIKKRLSFLPKENVLNIKFEDLIHKPICDIFSGLNVDILSKNGIETHNVGKYKDVEKIANIDFRLSKIQYKY